MLLKNRVLFLRLVNSIPPPVRKQTLHDEQIQNVLCYKYLGTYLDDGLSFKTRAKHLTSKVKVMLGFCTGTNLAALPQKLVVPCVCNYVCTALWLYCRYAYLSLHLKASWLKKRDLELSETTCLNKTSTRQPTPEPAVFHPISYQTYYKTIFFMYITG